MADDARKKTDKRLSAMETELTKIYQKSAKGIYAKWDKYMAEAAEKLKPLEEEYNKAKQSGDKDLIRETGMKLGQAKRKVTLQSNQYEAMLEETAKRLSSVNQTATAYLNKSIPDIYALNYNAVKGDAAKVGVKFGLVDAHTVKKLIADGDIKLPAKKISVPKDMRWNTKQLNSAVLQGILQGDSMQKIAKRILPIVNNNANAAIRNARTMVTGAECAGRNDSYKDLESRGVVLKKVWIATPDDRTRESHLELDGEEVDINEEFSNGLMYPGDPNGDPSEVYNCRCTMRTHIIGFRADDGSISEIDFEREETLHDRQIEEEKERREIEAEDSEEESTIVNGKDISATWERRPDEFDSEIEDIINAQGFDGLPRVVDAEEFDKIVKESGLFCQRVYSADTKEMVEEYQHMLYNGRWYVDCSEGGAAFGKGMYAGCSETGEETKQLASTMVSYAGPYNNIVETFTLRKGAKTISFAEITSPVYAEAASKFEDYGSFAAALGYDAITGCGRRNYIVVVNRTACVFKSGSTVQDYESIHNHWMDYRG